MLKIKTLFALGKGISTFASILLVSFLLLACNNLTIGGGSLIISTPGARAVTGNGSYTFNLTGSKGASLSKTVSAGSTVQFHALAPDTYTIAVEGKDADGAVVLGGSSRATVTAGETASATVNLVEGVGDYDSLQKAVGNGGTVNILKSIDVLRSLEVGNNVTIQAAYQDVTLKNTSSGNLFTVTNGNLTVGGGEHTITLDGNKVAQSIISVSGGTATLADNGIITNAAASGIKISSSGTFEMTGGEISKNKESSTSNGGGGVTISGGTFNITGGRIIDNTGSQSSGGVTVSGGTFNMTGGSITGNIGNFGGGVTISSGTFNMNGGTITGNKGSNGGAVFMDGGKFNMSGGIITGNTAEDTGGGIQLSGGTFILSGGYIDNNRASNGSGIYMFDGSFSMGGSAVINKNNDVFLSSGKMITITETLTGATPVATITPAVYEVRQILSFGTGNNFNLAEESTKFAVTPTDEGDWPISSGFLSQVTNES